MALTCPRCSTDVPDEALYCPYCNLPKPKRGFLAAEPQVEAEPTPVPQPVRPQRSPRRQPHAQQTVTKSPRKRGKSVEKKTKRVSFSFVIGSALVVLVAIGSYFFVLPMVQSDGPEPKAALQALDTLRHMPSRDEGVTIDTSLSKMLDQAKKAGNLASYEGWVIKPVKGDHSKVHLVYAYEQRDGEQKRAEWLADLSHNTFMPQNELAVAVSK